jgi:hypothetical protein
MPSSRTSMTFSSSSDTVTVVMHRSVPTYPEELALFAPFLEGHGAFVCDQDLSLVRIMIRDLNRRFGGLQVQVSPFLNFNHSNLKGQLPQCQTRKSPARRIGGAPGLAMDRPGRIEKRRFPTAGRCFPAKSGNARGFPPPGRHGFPAKNF